MYFLSEYLARQQFLIAYGWADLTKGGQNQIPEASPAPYTPFGIARLNPVPGRAFFGQPKSETSETYEQKLYPSMRQVASKNC